VQTAKTARSRLPSFERATDHRSSRATGFVVHIVVQQFLTLLDTGLRTIGGSRRSLSEAEPLFNCRRAIRQ
jgi:hypothetical protein